MILTDLPLEITAENIIRAQGMVFDLVKSKSPKLVEVTYKAIEVGFPYLEPRVVYDRISIAGVTPAGLLLSDSTVLEGETLKQHFADSREIVAAVCTIGGKIDELILETFSKNVALAMALEGLASAATEILGNSLCHYIDTIVRDEGLFTHLPINPGMTDWPVEVGQPQIFSLIDPSAIGVTLDATGLMRPLKSLSMIIGISQTRVPHQRSCDQCNLQKNCLYKPDAD